MKLNNDFTVNSEDLDNFQRIIDVKFENTANLIGPLVHGSLFSGDSARLNCFKTVNNLVYDNNEKLEFLGDSVLGLITSEYLCTDNNIEEYANTHGCKIEGILTDVRKALVSNQNLKQLASDLNLSEYILCSGLENIEDISENVVEALIGGIFLDGGYIEARKFVHKFFNVEGALGKIGTSNPKGTLQEFSVGNGWGYPHYEVIEDSGLDNDKWFVVEVYLKNEPVSTGSGSNIKEAEANAAANYLNMLSSKQEELRKQKAEVEFQHKAKEGEERATQENSIGMKFTHISAGEFIMGSDEYSTEQPMHKVKISKPFYLGTYPVTQREWKAVMGENPSTFKGDDLPVESVSWDDVQDFIRKVNAKEGTDKYRLPSETEWEYACRAGTTTRYSFGDSKSKLGDYAWYCDNSGKKTHPVGQKKPNLWGLYDMYGNVWEWVQDEWFDDYNGAPTDGNAWEDEDGSLRVVRGGNWYLLASCCRSANRCNDDTDDGINSPGFRLLQGS